MSHILLFQFSTWMIMTFNRFTTDYRGPDPSPQPFHFALALRTPAMGRRPLKNTSKRLTLTISNPFHPTIITRYYQPQKSERNNKKTEIYGTLGFKEFIMEVLNMKTLCLCWWIPCCLSNSTLRRWMSPFCWLITRLEAAAKQQLFNHQVSINSLSNHYQILKNIFATLIQPIIKI